MDTIKKNDLPLCKKLGKHILNCFQISFTRWQITVVLFFVRIVVVVKRKSNLIFSGGKKLI
jgi:hypothetical protein